MIRIATTATATLALALSLIGAEAYAADGKVYPGSMCKGMNDASHEITTAFAQYLRNDSTQHSALVTCPVVKDNVGGTNLQYIRVSFQKTSSTGFYCAIYGRTATGGGSHSSSQWNFSSAGTYNMVLPDIPGYSSGTYSLYCIIPPGGRIHSYRIDEQ